MSCHADGFVQFSLAPPLKNEGSSAQDREALDKWFSSFDGDLEYEMRDLRLTVDNNVAFSYSVNRMRGTRSGGENVQLWFRETLCFHKLKGEWKIAHEHESVPFYMDGSARAAIDLQP
jgi:ketosteroid isomerase-like protein